MKESNGIKVSNYWKKALYSSVVLGAIFVGGQYVSTVHASADTTQNANQPVATQIQFNDALSGSNITDSDDDSLVVKGYVGQQVSLVNAKIELEDLGYDVSNIPDTYTPTTAGDQIYPTQIKYIGIENEPNNLIGQYKLVFNIFDQNGNYIESKYDSTDDGVYSFTPSDPSYNSTGKKIIDSVVQDQSKFNFKFYGSAFSNYPISMNPGDNVFSRRVIAPTHTLTINYVNQNGVTVFKTTRQVTNFGHTNFYDDQNNFGDNNSGISINPDQPYVANSQSTATVNVTTNEAFQVPTDSSQVGSYDYGYPTPDDVIPVSDAKGSQNPDGDAYYTTVNVVGADGKNIISLILCSNQSQFVSTVSLDPDDSAYDSLVDFDNVTDLPATLDLAKGPYTFHSTDTLAGLQAKSSAAAQSEAAANQQAAQSAPASQSNQAPAPTAQQSAKSSAQPAPAPAPKPAPVVQSHPAAAPASTAKAAPAPQPAKAKPSKSQLKAVAKSYKQSKHAVKTDTAKLKALKKKMKNHATKKQKAAYKALQIKLAADKKAVKSYKAQEGKLTKYFKEVSIINRDNKQIKSLTAQLNKLKKKHSKANKKKAAKVQKALKKANNSLKAATKFVNDYK